MTDSVSSSQHPGHFDISQAFARGVPYDQYAWYREHDPVHIGPPRDWGAPYYLFRHRDVNTFLRDARLGKEWRRVLPPDAQPPDPERDTFQAVARRFMLFRDPPTHTHLRSLANLAFTPRQVERMREHVEELAANLVTEFKATARATGEPVDLIMNVAYPLPTLVIARILGVPREDFGRFRSWAADIAATIDFPLEGLEEFVARVDQTTKELAEYFRWVFSLRREHPQDDLISRLIHAESDEGSLDEDEVIGTCILLLVAGHETTVNLIGNGTLALLRYPDEWRRLVADPLLSRVATEELLRYDSPVQVTTRVSYEPIAVGDTIIPPGTEVNFMLGSANHDEDVFPGAGTVRIDRPVGRIMSFGMGIHFCLGAPLARLEGEVAFQTFARELPGLTLATSEPVWRPGAVLHGLRELPVTL